MKSRALLAATLLFAPLALGQMWEATRIGQQDVELLTDTGEHISWHQNRDEANEWGQKWSLEHELRTFITMPTGTRWDATAFAQAWNATAGSTPGISERRTTQTGIFQREFAVLAADRP